MVWLVTMTGTATPRHRDAHCIRRVLYRRLIQLHAEAKSADLGSMAMHPDAYTTLATIEPVGWYYQARVRCLQTLIRRFIAQGEAKLEILDVGCGTGGTSKALCPFGHVTGLEPSPLAIALLRSRYPSLDVVHGAVGDIASLFPPAYFDLATIMGVLYHRDVVDPASALRQVRNALKTNGWIVWNEAVYPILARGHDTFVEAGRRFYPRDMRSLLAAEGFTVRFGSHVLAWGFPIAIVLGLVHRAKKLVFNSKQHGSHSSDDRPLPLFLNAILREVTYLEFACSLRGIKMPFGVSYLVIAEKAVR